MGREHPVRLIMTVVEADVCCRQTPGCSPRLWPSWPASPSSSRRRPRHRHHDARPLAVGSPTGRLLPSAVIGDVLHDNPPAPSSIRAAVASGVQPTAPRRSVSLQGPPWPHVLGLAKPVILPTLRGVPERVRGSSSTARPRSAAGAAGELAAARARTPCAVAPDAVSLTTMASRFVAVGLPPAHDHCGSVREADKERTPALLAGHVDSTTPVVPLSPTVGPPLRPSAGS